DPAGGNSTTGTITTSGLYTAPSSAPPASISVSVSDASGKARSTPSQVKIFDPRNPTPGVVASTENPLVALYTIGTPQGSSVQVNFGTTPAYGLKTWSRPSSQNGGDLSIFVAGMRASTTYHMQAVVNLPDGTQFTDSDKTFTTGALPAEILPNIAVEQTPGSTPGSGVELLDLLQFDTTDLLTSV